jgi:hypothetical protein
MDNLLKTFASWSKIEYSQAMRMFTKMSMLNGLEFKYINFLQIIIIQRDTEIKALRNRLLKLEKGE